MFENVTRFQFGELPKFGYHQTPDSLLTDSWQSPDWLLTDSWLTPNWLPTDFQQTHIKPSNRDWRLKMTPGLNLESCLNQLSKFGYHQTPDILLTYSQQTSDRLTLNPATEIGDNTRSQVGELFKSAFQMESCLNQLSKFGELSKSALQILFLSVKIVLTDSWLTPNRLQVWFLTDLHQTPKQSMKFIEWWH